MCSVSSVSVLIEITIFKLFLSCDSFQIVNKDMLPKGCSNTRRWLHESFLFFGGLSKRKSGDQEKFKEQCIYQGAKVVLVYNWPTPRLSTCGSLSERRSKQLKLI
jgi:hypothetical protein